jgi:hypothetical protein
LAGRDTAKVTHAEERGLHPRAANYQSSFAFLPLKPIRELCFLSVNLCVTFWGTVLDRQKVTKDSTLSKCTIGGLEFRWPYTE